MIKIFEIKNQKLNCKVLNYGATIVDLFFKNRHLVLRFSDLETYRDKSLNQSFGSTVGRFANRIANAKFILNNQEYNLEKNDGTSCLHGGSNGFAHKIWNLVEHKENELILELKSEHLDQKFPGSIIVTAKFSLSDDTLLIQYSAKLDDSQHSDLNTIINLTNHTYFNLNGCEPAESKSSQCPSILDHEIYSSDAKAYLEQNSEKVPTGNFIELKDADLPFQINKNFVKLREGCAKGLYDHSFVFETDPKNYTADGPNGGKPFQLDLLSKISNIQLTMKTNNPSCHVYTGPRGQGVLNYSSTEGVISGICLESQGFPNSCNVPDWLNQCLISKNKSYSKFISFSFKDLDS